MFDYKKKMLGHVFPVKEETRADRKETRRKGKAKKKEEPKVIEQAISDKVSDYETHFEAEIKAYKIESAARYSRLFKLLVVSVFAVCLLVSAGIYGVFQWMYADLKPKAEEQLNQMHANLMLRAEKEFEQEKVQTVVVGLFEKLTRDDIETSIKNRIDEKVNPLVERLNDESKGLQAKQEELQVYLKNLKGFMALVSGAKNDSRKAYDELLAAARDKQSPFRDLAANETSEIYAEVNAVDPKKMDLSAITDLWSPSMTFENFRVLYQDAAPLYRPALLVAMWVQPTFSQYQKLDFLSAVISRDESLRALKTACRLMDEESGLNKPLIAYDRYLRWWEANRERYRVQSQPR